MSFGTVPWKVTRKLPLRSFCGWASWVEPKPRSKFLKCTTSNTVLFVWVCRKNRQFCCLATRCFFLDHFHEVPDEKENLYYLSWVTPTVLSFNSSIENHSSLLAGKKEIKVCKIISYWCVLVLLGIIKKVNMWPSGNLKKKYFWIKRKIINHAVI